MSLQGEDTARWLLRLVAFSALASLLLIALFILKEGLPFLFRVGLRNFLLGTEWRPEAGRFGIFPMIVASVWVTFGAMLVGGPLGVACALFLTEFTPAPARRVIKPTIELLAGIPSVLYGFLGVMVLAPWIRGRFGGPGLCVLNAALILGIMILPTTMITASLILAMGRALGETMAVIMVVPSLAILAVIQRRAKPEKLVGGFKGV